MGLASPENAKTEPKATRSRRRRSAHRRSRPSATRRHLRWLYFSLASVWGFTAGTVAVLFCVSRTETPWRLEGTTLFWLVVAGLLALAGGVVAAKAYHDASKRVH